MQKTNVTILTLLFASFLLGEVTRIPLINGVAISLLDVTTVIIWLVTLYRFSKNKKKFSSPLIRPLGLFVTICIVSLLTNVLWLTPSEIAISFLYTVRFVLLSGIYFFSLTLEKTIKEKIPFAVVLLGSLLVVVGLAQYFYIDFTTLRFLDWDIHWYRLFSTFIDPNFIGVFLLIPLFLGLFKLTQTKFKSKEFLFYSVSSIAILAGILLTYSRTALVGLLAGGVSYALLSKKARKVLLGIFICLCIGVGIILLNYQATEGTKLFRLSSTKARFTSVTNSLTIFSYHPVIGVGFNAFRYAMHKYKFANSPNWEYSHSDAGTDNSFLFVLATTGIIGFLAYLYFLYTIIYRIIFKQSATSKLKPVIFASFVSLGISSFFINALFYPLILALLWLLLALSSPAE